MIFPLTLPQYIEQQAIQANISPVVAIRLAKCESSLNPSAKNATSTATGLYQFTKPTWEWIGADELGLDRENAVDNLSMFLIWYPKYPGWWQCK